MRALPGDHQGLAEGWEQVVVWLRRLAEAHRIVHVHMNSADSGRPYARLHGELHHVATDQDGSEWFAVGDTAPESGDLGGPWTYLRLPKPEFRSASIETMDDDAYFGIAIEFGAQTVMIGDEFS